MKVIKRGGRVVPFDKEKIKNAIMKAFIEVDGRDDIDEDWICHLVEDIITTLKHRFVGSINIEDIQDTVENALMEVRKDVAKAYIKYRYDREKSRAVMNDLKQRYNKIQDLIKGKDEESIKENSNKDTRIIPTMRDYIAGFTCRRMAADVILPHDIVEAHNLGIIHYHDSDYSPTMPMNNCGLINLLDMLWNGTVISEVKIDRPKTFRTACTIATQIIAQVASSQYGFV